MGEAHKEESMSARKTGKKLKHRVGVTRGRAYDSKHIHSPAALPGGIHLGIVD